VSVQSRVNITDGGIQQFPTIGMEPDGDYVVAWSGRGVGDPYGIFVRRYNNPVDLAGPIVSDLVAPSGRSISSGDQITDELTQLTIVFDEEMMTTGPDSVTNPANYRLVHDGTLLSNVITNIQFGLNPATNKWEAVLTLDGNGGASGVVPLDDGLYQLTVLNSVRDKVGNPLGATGLNPKGNSISWTFNLLGLSSGLNQGETLISQGRGGEFTRPYATQAVASDADGDTVTVWTSETSGSEGIYARLTRVNWTEAGGERVPTIVDLPVVLVTNNPTADFASVASWSPGPRRARGPVGTSTPGDSIPRAEPSEARSSSTKKPSTCNATAVWPWISTAISWSPGRVAIRTARATASTDSASTPSAIALAVPTKSR
jgi:hypothetical protein